MFYITFSSNFSAVVTVRRANVSVKKTSLVLIVTSVPLIIGALNWAMAVYRVIVQKVQTQQRVIWKMANAHVNLASMVINAITVHKDIGI